MRTCGRWGILSGLMMRVGESDARSFPYLTFFRMIYLNLIIYTI
jgi:hypothetical protein